MKEVVQKEEWNALSTFPETGKTSKSDSSKIWGFSWGKSPVKLASATNQFCKYRNRSSDSSPTRPKELSIWRIKTSANGCNDLASLLDWSQVSKASRSSLRMKSRSSWNKNTTTKKTRADLQRLPTPQLSCNTAKCAVRQGMGRNLREQKDTPGFRETLGQNRQERIPMRHSKNRGTSPDPAALWQCGMEVIAKFCSGTQG